MELSKEDWKEIKEQAQKLVRNATIELLMAENSLEYARKNIAKSKAAKVDGEAK